MTQLKLGLKILKKILLGLLCFLVLYVSLAFLFSKITVNSEQRNEEKPIAIYIKTNGIHTDIVVPVANKIKDWRNKIKFDHTISKDTTFQFIGFGWGDKGFYLNTPQWSDLKVSTAANAAFYLGTSAMHATFYNEIRESEKCIKINISKANYQKLVAYIETSFQHGQSGNLILIDAPTYGDHDSFYEANGKYSLFYTCNSWANQALKSANQKAAFWSLTDTGIFCHYQ
ncbi:hypothetical protein FNO01nite_18640 [Flavobacterium noncentrifugens]|uniref:TIGR02117 family protein n=1 Tax=Flavobacterium noncentrifugens TaxID=1128970 RepID=A0A1G8YE76_9FLAO|nr:TIGR02117 family protein [Flavobacterium noncentrifugens]GEP51192.1 hypothetical protein FNO01nite_18640 [Flavobacterium noncentrifugens]SDK01148.1 conserved hypothetical protein [Flavobacterium noncentrifugens]